MELDRRRFLQTAGITALNLAIPARAAAERPTTTEIPATPNAEAVVMLEEFPQMVERTKILGTELVPEKAKNLYYVHNLDLAFYTTQQNGEVKRCLTSRKATFEQEDGQPMFRIRWSKDTSFSAPQLGLTYEPQDSEDFGQMSALVGKNEEFGHNVYKTKILTPIHRITQTARDLPIALSEEDNEVFMHFDQTEIGDTYLVSYRLDYFVAENDDFEIGITDVEITYLDELSDTFCADNHQELCAAIEAPRIAVEDLDEIVAPDLPIEKVRCALVNPDGSEIQEFQQHVGSTLIPQGPLFDGNMLRIEQVYFEEKILKWEPTLDLCVNRLRIKAAKVSRLAQGGAMQEVNICFESGFVNDYYDYLDQQRARVLTANDVGQVFFVENRYRPDGFGLGYDDLLLKLADYTLLDLARLGTENVNVAPVEVITITQPVTSVVEVPEYIPVEGKFDRWPTFAAGAGTATMLGILAVLGRRVINRRNTGTWR